MEVMRHYRQAVRAIPTRTGSSSARGRPAHQQKGDVAAFRRLMEESGINPDGHTWHETRYSVVTIPASQGVDLQIIQEIVGHSSETMTMHYRTAGLDERK